MQTSLGNKNFIRARKQEPVADSMVHICARTVAIDLLNMLCLQSPMIKCCDTSKMVKTTVFPQVKGRHNLGISECSVKTFRSRSFARLKFAGCVLKPLF